MYYMYDQNFVKTPLLFKIIDSSPAAYACGAHISPIRENVVSFKMRSRIGPVWRMLMYRETLLKKLCADFDCIVPIPNSPSRILHYGFYPSLALTEMIHEITRAPIVARALVMRRGNLQIKSTKDKDSKYLQLKKWLDLGPQAHQLKGRRVLLIDDVWNTGSTMRVAAECLEKEDVAPRVLKAFVLSFTHFGDNHAMPAAVFCAPCAPKMDFSSRSSKTSWYWKRETENQTHVGAAPSDNPHSPAP